MEERGFSLGFTTLVLLLQDDEGWTVHIPVCAPRAPEPPSTYSKQQNQNIVTP